MTEARTGLERTIVAVILLVFLAVGALYATQVPPYNAPDEPAHVNYARDVASGRLPVLQPGDWNGDLLERLKSARFPAGSDVSTIRYESHQPPLYYVAIAPVARLTRSLGDRGQVVALRLATLMVGAAALLALYAAVGELFVGDAVARLSALGLAAFIPMHVAVSASVSNDIAAELLLSLVLWRSLVALRRGASQRDALFLGLLVGLAALTKVIDDAAVPVAGLALLATGDRWRNLTVAAVVAGLVQLPWLLRGVIVYGPFDPFGLHRHDEVVVGQPQTGAITGELIRSWLTTLLHSFWGQFGWMGVLLDARIYLALGLLTALVGVGIVVRVVRWRRAPLEQRRAFLLAAFTVATVLVLTVGYNLTYLQPQGRYLFPAMAGIAAWAVGGLRELVVPRLRAALFAALCVGLVGLDLLALFRFVVPDLRS